MSLRQTRLGTGKFLCLLVCMMSMVPCFTINHVPDKNVFIHGYRSREYFSVHCLPTSTVRCHSAKFHLVSKMLSISMKRTESTALSKTINFALVSLLFGKMMINVHLGCQSLPSFRSLSRLSA